MKQLQLKKDGWIIGLIVLLACSILLNALQDIHINRLAQQIQNLEYAQQVMTSHIDSLESKNSEIFDELSE